MKRIQKTIKPILSILLTLVLVLEAIPSVPARALEADGVDSGLYGGAVSCKGVTCWVENDEKAGTSHWLTLRALKEEGSAVSYNDLYYCLYSPSRKSFATDKDGRWEYGTISEDWEDPTILSANLSFREVQDDGGDPVNDWQLSCLYMPNAYSSAHLKGITCSLKMDMNTATFGGLSVDVSGEQDLAGIHALYAVGAPLAGEDPGNEAQTPSYGFRTASSGGEYPAQTVTIPFSLPDPMPRTFSLRFLHAFWGEDGTVMLSGGMAGEHYLAAAYDDYGKMLEVQELAYGEDPSYSLEYHHSAKFQNMDEAADVKLFALDENFAPLPFSLEKPEVGDIEEAHVGTTGEKGCVSVSVAGTGSVGNVTIKSSSAQSAYNVYDDIRSIACVDISMEDGQLSGIAEIRIKYEGDGGEDKELSPAQLLPGYYNEAAGQWETPVYYVDEANHEVVILTDHFSKYALFEVEGSGTRHAFASALDASAMTGISENLALSILGQVTYYSEDPERSEEGLALTVLKHMSGKVPSYGVSGGKFINTVLKLSKVKAAAPYVGKLGKTLGILGLGISYLKVTYVCMKNWDKGLNNSEVDNAVQNAAIATGVFVTSIFYPWVGAAYLTYSLGKTCYAFYQEYNENARNEAFEKLHALYVKDNGGEWSVDTWRNYLDGFYDQYMQSVDTERMESNYGKFETSMKDAIHAYAYGFYDDYAKGRITTMYGKAGITVPDYHDVNNRNACSSYCWNYERKIYVNLQALMRNYQNRAYYDSLKHFENMWQSEMAVLNGQITLHFKEYGKRNILKDCYARFFDGDRSEWRVDFDENGEASLTFTLLSYIELGMPETMAVLDKKNESVVGNISLPPEIYLNENPAGVYEVDVFTGSFLKEFAIEEELTYEGEAVQFAGHIARLAPLGDGVDENTQYRFLLDENGRTSFSITSDEYNKIGRPKYIEVLNEDESKIIYVTPFSFAMDTVYLRHDAYLVHISCANDAAVKHFAGMTATLASLDEAGRLKDSVQSVIASDGRAAMMLRESEYVFQNGSFCLYVTDQSVDPIGLSMGRVTPECFQKIHYSNGARDTDVVLTWEEDESPKEYLAIDQLEYSLGEQMVELISVKAGEIGRSESTDPSVAKEVDGVIMAGKVGTATITLHDKNHAENEVTITVNVTKSERVGTSGFYKCITTWQLVVEPYTGKVREETNPNGEGAYYRYGSYSIGADRVINDIKFYLKPTGDPAWDHYNYDRYKRIEGGDRLYSYRGNEEWVEESWSRTNYVMPASSTDASWFYGYTYMSLGKGGYMMYTTLYMLTDIRTWSEVEEIMQEQGDVLNGADGMAPNGMAPDAQGVYTVTYDKAKPGTRYVLLVPAGNHEAFPAMAIGEVPEKLLYVNTLVAEGESLTFSFIPRRNGAASAFLAEAGGTPFRVDVTDETVEEEPEKYRIYFDPGEGTGSMNHMDAYVGRETALPPSTFTRQDYAFAGWTSSRWGYTVEYGDGALVKDLAGPLETITLYAIWEKTVFDIDIMEGAEVRVNGVVGTRARAGDKVDIKWNGTAPNMVFERWFVVPWEYDNILEKGVYEPVNSFVMPSSDVRITFNEEKKAGEVDGSELFHRVELCAGAKATYYKTGSSEALPSHSLQAGREVNLSWIPQEGRSFVGWSVFGVTPVDAGKSSTTFTMPARNVVVTFDTTMEGDEVHEDGEGYVPDGFDGSRAMSKLKYKKSSVKMECGKFMEAEQTPLIVAAKDKGEAPPVYYTTSNKGIVEVGARTGRIYGKAPGSATITAHCGDKTAKVKVTVENPTRGILIYDAMGRLLAMHDLEDSTDVSYFALNGEAEEDEACFTVKGGSVTPLSASFLPIDTTDDRKITWKSSNKKAVTVKNGVLTAKEVKEESSSIITATVKYAEWDPATGKSRKKTMSASFTVNVSPVEVPKAAVGDKAHTLSLSKTKVNLSTAKNLTEYEAGTGGKMEVNLTLTPKDKSASGLDYMISSCTSTNEDVAKVESFTSYFWTKGKSNKGYGNVVIKAVGPGMAYVMLKSRKYTSGEDAPENVKIIKVTVSSPAMKAAFESGTLSLEDAETADSPVITMRLGEKKTLGAILSPALTSQSGSLSWKGASGVTAKNGVVTANKVTKPDKYATVTVKCGKAKAVLKVRVVE